MKNSEKVQKQIKRLSRQYIGLLSESDKIKMTHIQTVERQGKIFEILSTLNAFELVGYSVPILQSEPNEYFEVRESEIDGFINSIIK